jgi:hypothetical protein
VKENNMTTVLKRNYPELAPALEGVKNPFAPWKAAGQPVGHSTSATK